MGGPRRWNSGDRAKALGYEIYLKESCPRCGTRREDFVDEETGLPLEEPMFYAVHDRCSGCEEWQGVDKAITDDMRRHGIYTTWVPAQDLPDDDGEIITEMQDERARAAEAALRKAPSLE